MADPFKYFAQIAAGVPIGQLLAEIDAQPELWGQLAWRKQIEGGPHGGMTDIWVRYNDIEPFQRRGDFKGFTDEHDSIWYPAYDRLPALRPIIYWLMQKVEGERIGGVLITRIPPGGSIAAHVDGGWHVNYYDKFYLSLKSAPGSLFCCGDEALNPKPGDVWRFDNRLRHWVKNDSAEDRITLIVRIRTRKFGGYNARTEERAAA